MKTKLIIALSSILMTACGVNPVVKTITLTNLVTMPKEWGPDGYGFRHFTKSESLLIDEISNRIDSEIWKSPTFIEDFTVIKTVTRDQMTVREIMDILGKQPNVAGVTYSPGGKRSFFQLGTLAYPQYEHEYRITKAQWQSLQDYCRLKLLDPIASSEVVEHWKSITNGIVPFGLKVK